MKTNTLLISIAAGLLTAASASAGTWTYTGDTASGTLAHSDPAWVLDVSVSETELTVTRASALPDDPAGLPLADGIDGGYSIVAIDESAFAYCLSLTNVTIGSGVVHIGGMAFAGCSNLTAISVSDDNTAYKSVSGVLFDKAGETLIQCPGGKSGAYTIPGSVSSIGDYAFADCAGLTGVTLTTNVASIGESALSGCTGLVFVAFMGTCPSVAASGDLYAGSPSVTNHIYCSAATSWLSQLDSGSFIGDTAFWCGRPVRLLDKPTLGVSMNRSFTFDNSVFPPVITIPGAFPEGDIEATNITGVAEAELKVTVKGLPSGMKYDAKTGQITGVPTKTGVFTVTVTVTGKGKASAKQTFTLEVAPLPEAVIGAFNGFARNFWNGIVGGTFTMTATKTGKLTAKAVTSIGTQSFSAKSWDSAENGVFTVWLANKKAGLSVTVYTATAPGEMGVRGGAWLDNAQYDLIGQKTETAPADTYTVALPVYGDPLEQGVATNAPLGDGYLTITVNNKGVVKLAGLAADGVTKLSASSTMLREDDMWYIPVLFKVNSGWGYCGGLLGIDQDSKISGFNWYWNYPGKKPPTPADDVFTVMLAPIGGAYTAAGAALYGGATFSAVEPPVDDWIGTWLHMPDVAITNKNGKLSIPSGKKPAKNRTTGDYTFDPVNPAVATLTVTAKSGIIKGKFNTYLEAADGSFKQTSVSYAGVLLPALIGDDDDTDIARGSYLIPWKHNNRLNLKKSYQVKITE